MIPISLEINSPHPCRKCIIRPCCKLDCGCLVKYITSVFIAASDHLEKNSYSKYEKSIIKSVLISKYVERFRPYPILGWKTFHHFKAIEELKKNKGS